MKELTVDVECYKNYFLVQFKHHASGKVVSIDSFNNSKLDRGRIAAIMAKNLTIGFNSNEYDLAMILAAIKGYNNAQLKKLSDDIIISGKKIWDIMRQYDLQIPRTWNHIDVKDPSPGVMVSLKTYGGRLGSQTIQDLPFEPDAEIQSDEVPVLVEYCENDLDTTWELYCAVKHEIELREQMGKELGKDLRSFKGAKVAKEYIMAKLGKKAYPPDSKTIKPFKYEPPEFINFRTDLLNKFFDTVKQVDFSLKSSGHVKLPKEVSKVIEFGGAKYKLGIGGIHSQEVSQSVYADNGILEDRDVTSYYPSLILNCDIYPEQLGVKFLKLYRQIYENRLKAKAEGDSYTANSLKLVLNSSFGLLGNKYSPLYSPKDMIKVTLTGQLSLLMLIEALHLQDIRTVSANTDGIVINYPKEKANLAEAICFEWELKTGLCLETNGYKSIHSVSVNDYVAITTGGKVKGKGSFSDEQLTTNPTFDICAIAIKNFLAYDTKIEDTIYNHQDVKDFLNVRNCKGGATWRGEYLGKVVRFYWSTDGDKIVSKVNGNKVAKSDGSKPIMTLTDNLPSDLDYQRYIDETYRILALTGYDK